MCGRDACVLSFIWNTTCHVHTHGHICICATKKPREAQGCLGTALSLGLCVTGMACVCHLWWQRAYFLLVGSSDRSEWQLC
jgi:hypothetical protein